jgi:hypothetical protein
MAKVGVAAQAHGDAGVYSRRCRSLFPSIREVRMIRTLNTLTLSAALVLSQPALAHDHEAAPEMTAEQKAMMEAYQNAATPGPAHEALAKSAGSYELTVKSWQAPGTEPSIDKGTATRRMLLEGRVLLEEVASSMMGQPFVGVGLHGYDNVSGKHWGTWNDSMGTGLMVSEGDCDAQGACTFSGSWNDPVTKGKTTARMTTRWTDPNTEVFEMFGAGPDGKEFKMMEIVYAKKP